MDSILINENTTVLKYLKAKAKKKKVLFTNLCNAASADPRAEKVDMNLFNKIITEKLEQKEKETKH